MYNNQIDTVISWMEDNGHEGFIDENNKNIVYYDDDDNLKVFCKINKLSLTKKIDYHNMYSQIEIT